MPKAEERQQLEVTSAAHLRDWLEAHHAQRDGVWLVTFKKQVADKYVSMDEVLDELLCFGWVDGARRKLDASRTMQLITPRRAHHWAQTYKDRAERLIATGRMQPAGLAAINASKRLGLWAFMDDVDALLIPEDFAAALRARPGASEHFAAFSDSSKRFTLRWIKLAKTAPARARRLEQASTRAAANKKIPGL